MSATVAIAAALRKDFGLQEIVEFHQGGTMGHHFGGKTIVSLDDFLQKRHTDQSSLETVVIPSIWPRLETSSSGAEQWLNLVSGSGVFGQCRRLRSSISGKRANTLMKY